MTPKLYRHGKRGELRSVPLTTAETSEFHKSIAARLIGNANDAMATLKPYPDDLLAAWPVGKTVNSPKNQGPELIEPVQD